MSRGLFRIYRLLTFRCLALSAGHREAVALYKQAELNQDQEALTNSRRKAPALTHGDESCAAEGSPFLTCVLLRSILSSVQTYGIIPLN